MIGKTPKEHQISIFDVALESFIDMNHELVLLSKQIEKFQNDAKNEIALRYEGFGDMEEETRVKYIRPTAITEFKDDEAAVEKIEEFLGEEAKPFVRKKAVNPTRLKGLLTEEQYGELVIEKARKPYVKMA